MFFFIVLYNFFALYMFFGQRFIYFLMSFLPLLYKTRGQLLAFFPIVSVLPIVAIVLIVAIYLYK